MRNWLENQYLNLFLYVPLCLATGAALYFTASREVYFVAMPFCTLGLLGCVMIKRVPIWLRAILLGMVGWGYAASYTHIIATPQLTRNVYDKQISGVVRTIDYAPDKTKLFLRVNAADINAGDGNAIIRVSVDTTDDMPQIGDTINATVGLFRPAPAYAPETFDYARWAYFNNLTATGYADNITVTHPSERKFSIDILRDNLHHLTNSWLADSLMLGYKNAIPKSDKEIWTAAGVGHIWSISGFHLTLVGGWIFAILYLIFRATPWIVRRVPAKIPALFGAQVGLMGYLFLSGADVATIRAFGMTTLMFIAFALYRNAISMRNVAIVFCGLFLLNPHNVMQAGFQLSFSAVFGLVWMYTVVRPKMPENKLLRATWACVLTSGVATIFTLPFVAIHFGAIPIYGMIGNLVLLPIFSFLIMPLVMIGVFTMVVDISWPIDMANRVYDFTLMIADKIATLPYATINVPHIPNAAIMLLVLGLISLVLIRNLKWKMNWILCAGFSALAIVCICINDTPIFYATYDNELVAFRGDDGKLEFNKSRASNHYFAFDTWKQINGEDINTTNRRRKHTDGIYRYRDIAYVQKFVPLMNNIQSLCDDDNVRYIVSYFNISSETCAHKLLRGGFVIYDDGRVQFTPTNRRWHYNPHQ